MSEHLIVKRYFNNKGLDLKATDLTRDPNFASIASNCQLRSNDTVEKRKGRQATFPEQEGYNMFTYNRIDPSSGALTPIVCNIGRNVYTKASVSMTVTYVGSDSTCLFNLFYDSSLEQFRCTILEGSSNVIDIMLGDGIDEASPYTINTLKTQIDLLANFTATVSGDGTVPAAFLKITRDHDLSASGSALTIQAASWTIANSPTTNALNGSYTHKNDDDFEPPSVVQLNNAIFIGNGYDEIHKFDGQNLYRAGLPSPSTPSHALVGAGSITGNNYVHKIQYNFEDAVGNVVESNVSSGTSQDNAAAQNFDVTVANIQSSTGFNTNCAIVNGLQTGVTTITVDNGSGGAHTMKAGDTAYFFDGASSSYVTRPVTGVTSTTITISGANVNVADNAVISNNLRIAIFRNKTAGSAPTTFYLVVELPNNSFAATQVYRDATVDASLGAVLVTPTADRSPPPKGKYLTSWRNSLIITGNQDNPFTFYWSDVEGVEYFPNDGSAQNDVDSITGDPISGCGVSNNVLCIGTSYSIDVVNGDLAEGNIRVDKLTTDIGFESHATIQECRGYLFFWYRGGPYQMLGGQLPSAIGESTTGGGRLEPILNQDGVATTSRYVLKKAISFNDRVREHYLTFIPCETSTGGNKYSNSFSRVFCYDYSKDAWFEWENIDMSSGICAVDEDLYWLERRFSTAFSRVAYYAYRRMNLNDAWDYEDHNAAIATNYAPQWDSLEDPSVLKRYLMLRVYSLEETNNNSLQIDCDVEVNYVADAVAQSFSFMFSGGGYGQSEYGTAPYGDPGETTATHKLGSGRIRSIRPIFKNEYDQQNMIITGWELEADAPYKSHIKK